MKLERYKDKKETRKKVMLIGLTVLTLISVAMMLYKTFANFRTTTSFQIMSGKVIYKKKALEFGTDIKEGVGGLYKVDHGGYGVWGQSELRYAGLYPSNYVNFNCDDNGSNCELWRIIGLVNVNTNSGVTQRIKIIRNDSNGYRQEHDYQYWDDSNLKRSINSSYYNSLKDIAKKMIASDIVWSTGGYADGIGTVSEEYSSLTSGSKWGSGYIGLMHSYDFGYAVGGSSRDWCLKQYLSTYDTACSSQNWLCKNVNEYTMDANGYQYTPSKNAIRGDSCIIQPFAESQSYNAIWRAVVYLASNVKITGGTGTSGDPYTLSLI